MRGLASLRLPFFTPAAGMTSEIPAICYRLFICFHEPFAQARCPMEANKKASIYMDACWKFLVGVRRFELPTSTSRTWRANRTVLHPENSECKYTAIILRITNVRINFCEKVSLPFRRRDSGIIQRPISQRFKIGLQREDNRRRTNPALLILFDSRDECRRVVAAHHILLLVNILDQHEIAPLRSPRSRRFPTPGNSISSVPAR